jgi:hypothetical protein
MGPEFLWKEEKEWPTISVSSIEDSKFTDDPEVKRDAFSAVLQTSLNVPIRNLIHKV